MEETKRFIEPNYKKDALMNTIANILYLAALWVMTILTPLLGGEHGAFDQGTFTVALSIANICTAFSTYNISIYQSSDINKKYSDNHYFYFGLTTTLISMLVALILCFSFGYLNGENGVAVFFTIILYYIFKSAENVSLIFYVSMQKQGKMYLSGYSLIVKAIVMLAIFAGVYAISKNLLLTMGCLAVAAYLYLFLVDFRMVKKYCGDVLKINKEAYKYACKLFIAALAVCVYGVCFAAIPSLPRMIYDQLASKELVGYFGTMAAVTVLIQAAVNALLVPFIPKITKAYNEHSVKEFYKIILGFAAVIFALTAVAFVMVHFLGDWALKTFVYRSEPDHTNIGEYSSIFQWVVLATGLQTLVILLATVSISMRKTWSVFVISLLGLAVMGSISYLFVKNYEMMGICYIYYLSYGVMAIGFLIMLIIYLHKWRKSPAFEVTTNA